MYNLLSTKIYKTKRSLRTSDCIILIHKPRGCSESPIHLITQLLRAVEATVEITDIFKYKFRIEIYLRLAV